MIALAKLQRSLDAPATLPARSEWLPTERDVRERRAAMVPVLHSRAHRAETRRFTGEPITGFGALA